MSEGKNLADHLCPPWHPAERKHETGEQGRREKDEEGHLYSLQLVFSDRGKRDAHREVCDAQFLRQIIHCYAAECVAKKVRPRGSDDLLLTNVSHSVSRE